MPTLNQPIFRSNAIKHYMEGREKHEFPRFMSRATTILLWVLLTLFIVATFLVWDEQVPTYVTTQGIVVVQPAAQSSVAVTSKQVSSTTGKQGSALEGSVQVVATEQPVPATKKPMSPTVTALFFFPPAQAQNLRVGMPVNLSVGSSGSQIKSQISSIEPDVMSPATLSTLFHLGNTALAITQPSIIVFVKLNPVLATKYANSLVSTNLQVGSQRLISFLPGVGGLFGQ
jgi:hypothetical protein